MARPPILSLALPSETGRVLSIQSHTVQVSPLVFSLLLVLTPFLLPLLSIYVIVLFFYQCRGWYEDMR